MLSTIMRIAIEPSDAPKSASGAFCQWRDHRADSVIRTVRLPRDG
ncbi:hypothetical protein SH449x_003542 [Pirellulaceae bacterium SH449]